MHRKRVLAQGRAAAQHARVDRSSIQRSPALALHLFRNWPDRSSSVEPQVLSPPKSHWSERESCAE